jgi:CheY-like chemotaxis protein
VADEKDARTVLVAEEDGWLRPLVAELLSDEGYRTVEADSGASVVELAEAHQPDAIVLDLALPAKPGTRVLRELRSIDATRTIPVILVSGETDEGPRQLFSQASISGVPTLPKPLDIGALFAALKHAIADRAA